MSKWLVDLKTRWLYLTDLDNPFIPWMIIIDLLLVVIHLLIVYWVYRDASSRYSRGAPWALLAAVLPLGGWLFYLLYRKSPLVQFDRIETETFADSEVTFTDYDEYQRNQGSAFFQELGALWRKAEKSGYSSWVRASRARELGKKLTPEERAERRAASKQQRLAKRKELVNRRREKQEQRRTAQIKQGRHGQRVKMSLRHQRAITKQTAMLDLMKTVRRVDDKLEELLYKGEYSQASEYAKEMLDVAEEMDDKQGIATYQDYLEQIQRLISGQQDVADG